VRAARQAPIHAPDSTAPPDIGANPASFNPSTSVPRTALVHVEQTGLKAKITGVVTDGWLKGSAVKGRYTQISCAHDATTTDCFQGTLDINHSGR